MTRFVVCQTHPSRKIPFERHCERSGAEFVVFLVLGGERESGGGLVVQLVWVYTLVVI